MAVTELTIITLNLSQVNKIEAKVSLACHLSGAIST